MSEFLRQTQLQQIRQQNRVHEATARLKSAVTVTPVDVRELQLAARHLIRLLEAQ